MAKVLVCDPIHPAGVEMLKAKLQVEVDPTITADQLLKRIGEFDALVVRGRTKVTAAALDAARHLKVVARSGVGLDNIDLEAAKKRSIKVISTPAAPTTSVAELTIGLMLNVLRKISYADRTIKEGRWVKNELIGSELKSKTVGIIGAAGRIGVEVARIAVQGFGSKVLGYDVIDLTEKARLVGFTETNLDDLLRQSHIISIHVPYLPTTHHLVNKNFLEKMKRGAVVINASRGDIIDGQALLQSLKAGQIAGAGLDVFHKEPPVDEWEKSLTQLPNVVCTAHVGAQTIECQKLESVQIAEQLIQLFQ
ncbi:MAG: hydroxyacid dehydrogenase [Candidatus Bathyarchaeia archaeon]